MTFMPWTDELRIGIDLIDEQHRWLVDSTNALHDEISKPAPVARPSARSCSVWSTTP